MRYNVSRVASRLLTVACLVALGACHSFDPNGDTPFNPPAEYRAWWAKTEACSGLHRDFDRVRWFVVEGHSFPCKSGQCVGHWESNHEIWIAKEWVSNEMVVRHEILHELLDRPGHPNPPFGAECPLTWATWQGDVGSFSLGHVD